MCTRMAGMARRNAFISLLGKVMLQQLPHRHNPLTQILIGQSLQIASQFLHQLIEMLGQVVAVTLPHRQRHHVNPFASGKTRITQPQNRVQTNEFTRQRINVFQQQWLPVRVKETAPGAHRTAVIHFTLQTVENAL